MPETLHPPFAQALRFSPRAVARSESANYHQGEDIRLHLVVRGHEGRPCLIVNDCLGGQWGEELRLPLTPEEALAPTVEVAFTGGGILVQILGEAPVAFRPGEAPPQSLLPRHGPDVTATPAELPAESAPAAAPVTGDGVIEAAAGLPGTGHRLLVLRLADAGLEAALVQAPAPMRLRDAAGAGTAAPALFCALPGGGLLAAIAAPGEAAVTGAELLPPGRPPLHLSPARGLAEAPRPMPAEFVNRLAAAQGPAKREMERLLARGFTGRDTLAWLSAPVRMRVARGLRTPEGLLLQGWLHDPQGAIRTIRLRAGEQAWPLKPGAWLDTMAWDGEGGRGFLARAPVPVKLGEAWLDVTLTSGESGTLPLPAPESAELPALRAILAEAGAIPEAALDHAFGSVLGQPLVALNRQRLARPMAVEERAFGTPPASPRASLVIPLHGRLDMMAAQMALFSACRMARDEVIFVLDDPPRRAAALGLAQSAFDRFGMPLRLILPGEARGFGPASNLGMRHAKGEVVVFLNADAFPQGTDWLDRLVEAVADPSVGAAGAQLLYPDGSLQHGGMALESGPGGWLFPEHPGKGLRPPEPADGPRDVEALTGACLALRREVAQRFGGFDEDYVIGDFEDADLSARLAEAGLRRVMVDAARLVHLERQSQGRADEQAGRWNLTLLNAWTYNHRWRRG
ncbi:glycosyltransferase family 2 protein [Sediminicoccus sp. BL-A-41-H5]|uniref:glycosyltransferase family 2 protein n=1 Tax=Sediminicoccus sp. BL-A-41-H5 TaxID=3421106 RepID=UPI003D6654B0